jgi:hypothetical protein
VTAAKLGEEQVALTAQGGEVVFERPHPLSELGGPPLELGGLQLGQVLLHPGER